MRDLHIPCGLSHSPGMSPSLGSQVTPNSVPVAALPQATVFPAPEAAHAQVVLFPSGAVA